MMRQSLVVVPVLLAMVAGGCGSENEIFQDLPEFGLSKPPPIEDVHQTDYIVQVTEPKVDILWMIDNSCSMADEQDELTSNFPLFMNYFVGSGLDYHVGVTSSDIDGSYNGANGKLVEAAGIKYIDADTPGPVEVFVSMATLGVSGSGNEKGLGAIYKCLEDNRDTWNAGFYRDEASVHTIVISDEPDNTPAGVVTQDEFVDWYDSLKDEADLRTFSSIIDMNYGTKYKNVSLQIGGIVWDVQDDDWPLVLDGLGVQAAGLKREYFLSHLPVPETIEVSVEDVGGAILKFDEAILDPITGEVTDTTGDGLPDGEWTYEPSRNSISFLNYIPNALSTVIIDYTLLASQQQQTDVDGGEAATATP
jgi:hypothetical protein